MAVQSLSIALNKHWSRRCDNVPGPQKDRRLAAAEPHFHRLLAFCDIAHPLHLGHGSQSTFRDQNDNVTTLASVIIRSKISTRP